MRYLEWLFPIHRYIRLRREVSGLAALTTFVASAVAIAAIPAAFLFLDLWPRTGPAGLAYLATSLFWSIAERLPIVSMVLLFLASVACLAALIRVRRDPAGRQRRCAWQTFKFALLGSQTWAWGAWLVAGLLACCGLRDTAGAGNWRAIPLAFGAVFLLDPPLAMLATIFHAGRAVIALRDDSRCIQCGYLLIGLKTPRCPECGTPFDPARLEALANVDRGDLGGPA